MSDWVNACYALLDSAVVRGRADDPALTDDRVTHARLLEDVAAIAGVLRAQGVTPGVAVSVTANGRRGVTALLAVARLGGVLDRGVVVDDASVGELAWDEALRLGRTDPAPVADLAPDAPWSRFRTVGELSADLAALQLPTSAEALASVLRSSVAA